MNRGPSAEASGNRAVFVWHVKTKVASYFRGSTILKVAAVVPAYNEGERLGPVLEAIQQAKLVDEIVVVNDGSTDDTGSVAAGYPGVRALNLPTNKGKGGAMYAGASSTDAEIILFLDADLIGISGDQIDSIVKPVFDGETDMCIGVFRGGRKVTDIAQVITPYISGQRALKRDAFLDIEGIGEVRSGVEVAITKHFRAHNLAVDTVILEGCTHPMKEEKIGYVKGFAARLKMYYEIGKISFDVNTDGESKKVVQGIRKLVRKKETH